MAYTLPSLNDFKTRYARDFPFATPYPVVTGQSFDASASSKVMDSDLNMAFTIAFSAINQELRLFPDQAAFSLWFMPLAAHYLCVNLRNSSQGIAGTYPWLTNSKGVGNVNEAYVIPDKVKNNPFLASLSGTSYGAAYLAAIVPFLYGNFRPVFGYSHPT